MSPARSADAIRSDGARRRELTTPEGLSLPLTLASRGARAGALLLDIAIVGLAFTLFLIVLVIAGFSVFEGFSAAQPALELIGVALILIVFLSRYGYFLWFELGPRGATPGKRLLGIRVAARPRENGGGGRLTAEAILARNLMRDVEVFIPGVYLISGEAGAGVTGVATAIWLAIFALFPFFNRDNLRAGDLVAGTWVVEAERRKLPEAMSTGTDRSREYVFGAAELSVYGAHELQVLESVLRQDNAEAQREVTQVICRKIGWQAGSGDERAFLEAFYAALRAHLERDLRFGRRKKDKFDR